MLSAIGLNQQDQPEVRLITSFLFPCSMSFLANKPVVPQNRLPIHILSFSFILIEGHNISHLHQCQLLLSVAEKLRSRKFF